jgi:predicted nucleic acid-binding protein
MGTGRAATAAAPEVFVDTSALYALLASADPSHERASRGFARLAGRRLVTHSYVVVEAAALVQRRLGMAATRDLLHRLLRPVRIVWVDEDLHRAASSLLLATDRVAVSLVDCASFELMRRRGIAEALAFDDDFAREGFRLVG